MKCWIAESVFVDSVPAKALVYKAFEVSDGEPLEILAFYVYSRLGFKFQETLGNVVESPGEEAK